MGVTQKLKQKKSTKSEKVGKNGPVPSSNSQIMSRGQSIAGDRKTNFHLLPWKNYMHIQLRLLYILKLIHFLYERYKLELVNMIFEVSELKCPLDIKRKNISFCFIKINKSLFDYSIWSRNFITHYRKQHFLHI